MDSDEEVISGLISGEAEDDREGWREKKVSYWPWSNVARKPLQALGNVMS